MPSEHNEQTASDTAEEAVAHQEGPFDAGTEGNLDTPPENTEDAALLEGLSEDQLSRVQSYTTKHVSRARAKDRTRLDEFQELKNDPKVQQVLMRKQLEAAGLDPGALGAEAQATTPPKTEALKKPQMSKDEFEKAIAEGRGFEALTTVVEQVTATARQELEARDEQIAGALTNILEAQETDKLYDEVAKYGVNPDEANARILAYRKAHTWATHVPTTELMKVVMADEIQTTAARAGAKIAMERVSGHTAPVTTGAGRAASGLSDESEVATTGKDGMITAYEQACRELGVEPDGNHQWIE